MRPFSPLQIFLILGATGHTTGDERPFRGMLTQPNVPCPATGSASSFVGNVQDPVPFDNNDTHAILEPMQDSFQHDNNDDNEGDNNGPICSHHEQRLPHSDSDPNGPSLQSRSNSNSTLMNCSNTNFSRSQLGRPTIPSLSFLSSSVHPLSPSAISLQTPSVTPVDSYSITSFSSSSALPIAEAMPAYPSPTGLSDPIPSQPNTSSSLPSQPRFLHHQHHSFQQQQLQQRHSHIQRHQNDNQSSNDTHLQRPTHSSRQTTLSTHRLHQSSPLFPSTLPNSSLIISYPSHNHSSTPDHHHHLESATGHGSTSFSSWTDSRLPPQGGSEVDGHISPSSPRLSAQQQQYQQQRGSGASHMDNTYIMPIHQLQQATSSSVFSSPSPSPSRRSFNHLQQGQSRLSSHLTLPTRDLIEDTPPYFHRSLSAATHPLDNVQTWSNVGSAGTSLVTESGQDLWETPGGRERRSRMAEGVNGSDTWQPFSSVSYTPDASTQTYISSPGEMTLRLDMPDEDSNGPRKVAAMSGTIFNRPRGIFYIAVLCTTICD